MKKKIIVLTFISLILSGCSGSPITTSSGDVSGQTSSQSQIIKYIVHFANTSMNDVQVEEGKSLAKPTDPSKANSIFAGWFKDSAMTQEVGFPLTISAETTIYAKFYSYQEAFQLARANTIGDDVAGYEYDYTLEISAGYMNVTLRGNATGNSKYNASSTDITFYDAHENSGLLFNDGSKYSIKKGRELHEISLDENDVVKKYKISEVGEEYKYDSSSFAKAVFEYDDTKLKEIEPTSTANEYKLKTAFNVSSGIALVGNYVNHPMVEKLVGELPETSVDTGMYVTFSGGKLNTYRYAMEIDVTGIQLSLSYCLTFKNVGVAPTISPRVFNNTYISNDDVETAKAKINGYLTTFKELEHSSYDFKAKTAVDYAKKNAINATIDGWTKRKVSGDEVYYLNDYEVDTDHKNADLYKETGLKDCHAGRVKLSTGEVHDLKNKLIGGYSDIATITGEAIDDYYLLDVLAMIDNVSFVQKIANSANGAITYAIGADTESAINVLKEFNNTLRLNPLGENSTDVKAFGTFSDSSVTVKDFKFTVVVTNGALTDVSLTMNGEMTTAFLNSRDFTNALDAGYKLEYSLKVTNKGSSYEPASTVDKVK